MYNNDRTVEIAAVSVDSDGHVIDEWDTLVDPQRDVGPTWLHGMGAPMVSNTPTFEEVGSGLAFRLEGAVVGHNLHFDRAPGNGTGGGGEGCGGFRFLASACVVSNGRQT